LKLPIIASTTARGATFPELVEALPGIEIIDRSSVSASDDARVARAIEANGRKKLIFPGTSLEVVLQTTSCCGDLGSSRLNNVVR
jgi:hypothetical protein